MQQFRRLLCALGLLAVCACGADQRAVAPTPRAVSVPAPTVTQVPTVTAMRAPPTLSPMRVPPTATPMPTPPAIAAYTAYRVRPDDTLAAIGERGGTTAELLRVYNHLAGEPQVGRELLVPQLVGYTSVLSPSWLLIITGNTIKPWVALTFDCGGQNPRAGRILSALAAYHAHATFFLLGESIVQDPVLLRRMVAEGHELANHSYTHADFTKLSDAQIVDELKRTEAAVQRIVPGATTRPYVRLPYGAYTLHTLSVVVAQGYLPVHWTLDSLDWRYPPPSPQALATRVTTHLAPYKVPGAIYLSHCTDATIDALPLILKTFKEQGIEVHTLSDVLGA